jgi:hypothetical protein
MKNEEVKRQKGIEAKSHKRKGFHVCRLPFHDSRLPIAD